MVYPADSPSRWWIMGPEGPAAYAWHKDFYRLPRETQDENDARVKEELAKQSAATTKPPTTG